jgi:3-hydroxyacyl-CoA dehydrogenase
MGPFQLVDVVGLDVTLAIIERCAPAPPPWTPRRALGAP